jgi:two-component system, cell cycle response regulator DivK
MPRCLIVDDHDDSRDGFREYLENYGFDVAGTATAEDALTLMTDRQFDLLIVDLQLPVMNGWDLIETVRKQPRHQDMAIAAVSACVFPDDRQRASDAGCDAFLAKPCPPDELLATVNRLLAASPSAQ